MVEAYILTAVISSGVSSVVTSLSILGYRIHEGWRREREMYQSNNLTRRISRAKDSARYLEELGYSEAAGDRKKIAEAYESLHAQNLKKWNSLSLWHKFKQATALGFS